MKRKNKAIALFVAMLILAVLACGGGPQLTSIASPPTGAPFQLLSTETPIQPPVPTIQTPAPLVALPVIGAYDLPPAAANELVIVNSFSFTGWGEYYVVGELYNGSDRSVGFIELTIEITDASGNSLLKDDNDNIVPGQTFSPEVYVLAPGEFFPFRYSLDGDAGKPSAYKVTITGQQPYGKTRPNLKIEHAQMVEYGEDSLYITGEIVNLGDKWVIIDNVSGAAVDDGGQVLSVYETTNYMNALAPTGDAAGGDRTPFRVELPSPGVSVAQGVVYLDAEEADSLHINGSLTPYVVSVQVLNYFFDKQNRFHLVGMVTNNDRVPLEVDIQVGVYTEDGTVLDADYDFTFPFVLIPGESIPFSFQSFNLMNQNPRLTNSLYRVSAQVDQFISSVSYDKVVALQTSNDQVQKDARLWKFTGDVTNTSSANLNTETVIVAIYDGQGNLVASDEITIYPDGNIIPAQTVSYTVSISLDPNADATNFTFKTFVQGSIAH